MNKITASARLEIVIDIPSGSSWGEDCAMNQIYRQASEETINSLRQLLKQHYGPTAKIFGEPKVRAVFAERE